MAKYRTRVDPEPLQACRAALMGVGVDVAPEGLKRLIRHAVEIAGVLAREQVTLEIDEQTGLKVDLHEQTVSVIHYKGEQS